MSNMRGFDAAQRAYENMLPPEDGPSECCECGGSGRMAATEDHEDEETPCANCDGFGWLTADGEPFDPNAAQDAAADYADWKRDEVRCARVGKGLA